MRLFFFYQFVLEKHTYRRGVAILVLTVPYGSYKGHKENNRHHDTYGYKNIYDTHSGFFCCQNYFPSTGQNMIKVILRYFKFLLIKLVSTVTKTTMVTELKGMRIAAITGDNFPETAKDSPIIL